MKRYLTKEDLSVANKHITKCLKLLGKCKVKWWDTMTHPLEWLKFKRLTMTNFAEDIEQWKFSYTDGRNIKW